MTNIDMGLAQIELERELEEYRKQYNAWGGITGSYSGGVDYGFDLGEKHASARFPTYLNVSSIGGKMVVDSWMTPDPDNYSSLIRCYQFDDGIIVTFTQDEWRNLCRGIAKSDYFLFETTPSKAAVDQKIRCGHCRQVSSFDDGCKFCGAPE